MPTETASGLNYPSLDMAKEPPSETKQEGDISGRDSLSDAQDGTVYIRGIQFWMISIAYVCSHLSALIATT